MEEATNFYQSLKNFFISSLVCSLCSIPVSYTHLDVYKRQLVVSVLICFIPLPPYMRKPSERHLFIWTEYRPIPGRHCLS